MRVRVVPLTFTIYCTRCSNFFCHLKLRVALHRPASLLSARKRARDVNVRADYKHTEMDANVTAINCAETKTIFHCSQMAAIRRVCVCRVQTTEPLTRFRK